MFGNSISCTGDIDKDGFADFAVGAPYESNPFEFKHTEAATGAVYIFRGASEPAKIKVSQKVFANSIQLSPALDTEHLKGFGYSLSGGLDMDSNKYPDLAIGVLNSNMIVVLRARPVVRLRTWLKNNASLQELDHKKGECSVELGGEKSLIEARCFWVEFCVERDLLSSESILLNYSLSVERGLHSRVYFSLTNTNMINSSLRLSVDDDEDSCASVQVVFKKDNYDYITPIQFDVSYKFANQDQPISRDLMADINNYPVIHEDTAEFRFKANFKTECGSGKSCFTDLRLHAKFLNLTVDEENVSLLSFKESDSVSILVRLDNTGFGSEPAYATEISILFDERLDFIKKEDLVSFYYIQFSINWVSCLVSQQKQLEPYLFQIEITKLQI